MQNRDSGLKNKNNLLQSKRKYLATMVYSPEYVIRIEEAVTPLYHSDEYEPTIDSDINADEGGSSYELYIDRSAMLKMHKEEHEEHQLINQLRRFKIDGSCDIQ